VGRGIFGSRTFFAGDKIFSAARLGCRDVKETTIVGAVPARRQAA
jgi:hypothetical protein